MNCIIIEDEIPAQRIMKNYIAKIPDLNLVGCYQSALDANSSLQKDKIDVLFLDINLPDISGLHYIKTLTNPPFVIITTARNDYAVESFELDTICDYLLKPFSFERFLKALNKLKKLKNAGLPSNSEEGNSSNTLFLNIDKTLHKIDIENILYIASDRNYVTVATEKSRFSYLDSLKNWSEKLTDSNFVQIHKSYIINTKKIEKITGNIVFLRGEKIPIGRFFKSLLLRELKLTRT